MKLTPALRIDPLMWRRLVFILNNEKYKLVIRQSNSRKLQYFAFISSSHLLDKNVGRKNRSDFLATNFSSMIIV